MTSRDAGQRSPVVPYWKGIYWLALAGLVLRLVFAWNTDNIYHPDEVFQYLEPAHRLVFGYGMVPWEYHFGTRSWLIPFFISIPLYLCKLLHIDEPDIYIPLVKSIFCLISTSLIFSGYTIGRRLVSESAGRLTAMLCCFWYELLYVSFRPLADVVSTYFLVGSLACVLAADDRRRPYLFGFLAAMSIALRVQYAPVIGVITLFAALTWDKDRLVKAIIAFAGVVVFAGGADWLMWGSWFASYYNNYLFNFVYGVSKKVFGEEDFYWYAKPLVVASMGIFACGFLASFCYLKRLWLPILCVTVLIGEHTLIAHKEYRFIFAAIPLFLMLTAAVIVLLSNKFISMRWVWCVQWMTIGALGAVSVAGILNRLPEEHDVYFYEPLYATYSLLPASRSLYYEKDLSGVLINSASWSISGGYYYLHRDVPVYFYDQLNETPQNPGAYVSHIISFLGQKPPGFSEVAQFGEMVIQKQIHPPAQYLQLPSYTRYYGIQGIDDQYKSTVTLPAIDHAPQ